MIQLHTDVRKGSRGIQERETFGHVLPPSFCQCHMAAKAKHGSKTFLEQTKSRRAKISEKILETEE